MNATLPKAVDSNCAERWAAAETPTAVTGATVWKDTVIMATAGQNAQVGARGTRRLLFSFGNESPPNLRRYMLVVCPSVVATPHFFGRKASNFFLKPSKKYKCQFIR